MCPLPQGAGAGAGGTAGECAGVRPGLPRPRRPAADQPAAHPAAARQVVPSHTGATQLDAGGLFIWELDGSNNLICI